jgi:hypothetical protein
MSRLFTIKAYADGSKSRFFAPGDELFEAQTGDSSKRPQTTRDTQLADQTQSTFRSREHHFSGSADQMLQMLSPRAVFRDLHDVRKSPHVALQPPGQR